MKKIIVIGASQGLGLALTRSLLEAGCQTAAGVLGDEALAPLKEQYPDQLLVFPGDVTDMAQLKAGDVMERKEAEELYKKLVGKEASDDGRS